VLFDRDGTLVEDVPYNGDPDLVRPLPGARRALDLLRAAGVATGVVSNQSGIGRGLLTHADVGRVNARADALLGGLGTWVYCPHLPEAGCDCRKPRPGLVIEAARRLGVAPSDCVVIGDIGADVLAARAAGARGVLVPNGTTRPEEIETAPRTAPDLLTAVRELLDEAPPERPRPSTAVTAPAEAPPADAPNALVVRLDSFGDVLLAGPAVRAVATHSSRVTMLCGPLGAAAARLLPGVDDVITWAAPWEGVDAPTVADADVDGLLERLKTEAFDIALILTSFHQSPLPTALLLRMAGLARIGADSVDHPGRLLDVRHRRLPGRHEAEAALDTAAAMGFLPPPDDDGRLRVVPPPDTVALTGNGPYVVVHPGASAPARAWSPERCAEAVALLADAGHRVVVTGGPAETGLTRRVAGGSAVDLGGRTSPRTLAGVLRTAEVVVSGNTGPAHLAAAVATPVVSLFAPVVPAERWAPYGVPHVLLGDQNAPCADSRARHCPVPGHPCLDEVTAQDVVRAVQKLLKESA
jgi:HAD superfamily hydrolase (TIGR01662 family)